jgi:hypothetical protein
MIDPKTSEGPAWFGDDEALNCNELVKGCRPGGASTATPQNYGRSSPRGCTTLLYHRPLFSHGGALRASGGLSVHGVAVSSFRGHGQDRGCVGRLLVRFALEERPVCLSKTAKCPFRRNTGDTATP